MHLSRRQWVIAALLTVGVIFYGVLALKGDSSQNALRARGVHTNAVVVDRIPNGRQPDTVVVRFTSTAGRQVDEALPANTFVDGGDNVSVVYDPKHPSNVRLSVDVTTAGDDRGAFIFGTAVCGLLLVLTLTNTLKWRVHWRARQSVPVVPAAITPLEATPPVITDRQMIPPVATGEWDAGHGPKRRPVGEQLHRSRRVMHASWLTGLAVFLGAGGFAGGFNVGGVIFLVLVFLPILVAWRRDRLSFPIIFASLFLPAWPWAMYKAVSRAPRPASTPV